MFKCDSHTFDSSTSVYDSSAPISGWSLDSMSLYLEADSQVGVFGFNLPEYPDIPDFTYLFVATASDGSTSAALAPSQI